MSMMCEISLVEQLCNGLHIRRAYSGAPVYVLPVMTPADPATTERSEGTHEDTSIVRNPGCRYCDDELRELLSERRNCWVKFRIGTARYWRAANGYDGFDINGNQRGGFLLC